MVNLEQLLKYDLFIIDMDGTLYYQNQMRTGMLRLMVCELFANRKLLGELYAVYMFRRIREDMAGNGFNDGDIYEKISEKTFVFGWLNAKEVERIIQKWIYEKPLEILRECRDDKLFNFIKDAVSSGKQVYIYSDYPVESKMKVLGIDKIGIKCIDASKEEINAYKPSPKGIEFILRETGVPAALTVMIGDREDRDGAAARNAGIDAVILNKREGRRYING